MITLTAYTMALKMGFPLLFSLQWGQQQKRLWPLFPYIVSPIVVYV